MTPKTEDDLARMVADATGPLAIRGAGTRGLPLSGAALSLAGLTGIDLYEPGALTLVARAGTPLAEIDAVLGAENQRLAFEPMDHRGLMGTEGAPTIGGVVAGNISGPRRIQVGACRDHLLGVRYVDGRGTVIANGGRVMKNVTGYDLVKLMAGSWGTLGVLSQVALKVLPRPETQATLRLHGLPPERAVAAMSRALGSPYEVTGAAHAPAGTGDGPETVLRVEGFEGSVAHRLQRLEALLAGFGAVSAVRDAEDSAAIWRGLRDVAIFQDRPGDVWRLSVKPSEAPAIIARLAADDVLLDWGGGLIWARVPQGFDLRAHLGRIEGHATLVRAAAETRARLGTFQPEPPPLDRISAGLRARFDPRGLFNPGLMAPREKDLSHG